jgi:hypothetical protein
MKKLVALFLFLTILTLWLGVYYTCHGYSWVALPTGITCFIFVITAISLTDDD